MSRSATLVGQVTWQFREELLDTLSWNALAVGVLEKWEPPLSIALIRKTIRRQVSDSMNAVERRLEEQSDIIETHMSPPSEIAGMPIKERRRGGTDPQKS